MKPADRIAARALLAQFFDPPLPPLEGSSFGGGWEGHLDRADELWVNGRPLDAWAVWSEVRCQEDR